MKRALVLTLALVLGLGIAAFAAGPFSGSWSASLSLGIDPSTTPASISVSSFSSTLGVDYTMGGWTFASTSIFGILGWTVQDFTANGTMGAFTVASDLLFNPQSTSFTTWDTQGSVSIAGVTLNGEFRLNGNGTGLTDINGYPIGDGPGAGWSFGASGQAGDMTLGATAYFNSYDDGYGILAVQTGYCFCFSSIDLTASFPFACITEVDAALSFDATNGFNYFSLSATGLSIPNFAWVTFDAQIDFTTTSKVVTITPEVNIGTNDCISVYASLNGDIDSSGALVSPFAITGFTFDGFKISHTWNGITFTDITSLDSTVYDMTGDYNTTQGNKYWELFEITSSSDSCCGGALGFTVDTWFGNPETAGLFGWSETDVSVSIGVGSNFTITTGLNVDTTGLTGFNLGFSTTW